MKPKTCVTVKRFFVMVLTATLVISCMPVMAEPVAVYAAENRRIEIETALYNAEYYEKANEDVAVALGYDAEKLYEHWLNHGKAEGRNASMVFNAKYYLEKNPDVAAKVGNDYEAAYEHFVTEGLAAGLESSPVFSVKYYLEANADVANEFSGDYVKAANHFNTNAIAEGRSGSGNFDYTVYRACNTDVEELYGDYIEGYYIHYINHGRAEGRTGGLSVDGSGNVGSNDTQIDRNAVSYRIFDAEFYLATYPELEKTVGTDAEKLYLYWIHTGIGLGQTASPVIVPKEYLDRNSDVAEAFGEDYDAAIQHFLNSGIYEGRSGSYEFDYTVYKVCNTDVVEVFGEDIVGYYFHYVQYGMDENRTARLEMEEPEEIPKEEVKADGVPAIGTFPEIILKESTIMNTEVLTSLEEVNSYVFDMILDGYYHFGVMAEDLSMLHTAEEYMYLYPIISLEVISLVKYNNGYYLEISNAQSLYEIDAEHIYAIRTNDTSILNEKELKAYEELLRINEELGLNDMETDIEKIIAVHDYLLLNVAYDEKHLENEEAGITNESEDCHYVEGTLLNGLAVCSGYASTFRLFMIKAE